MHDHFKLDENDPMPPCPKPKPIAHGITDWEGGSSKARFACFQGYHLVGPPQMECRYGTWYSTYPTCKPIVCNQPTIPHGRLETGDSIRYISMYLRPKHSINVN